MTRGREQAREARVPAGKEAHQRRLIKVKLVYVGMIRRLLGRGQEEIEFPSGSTLKELLEHLISVNGPKLGEQLFTKEGELMPTANLMVDGLNPIRRGGLETRLCEEGEARVEIVVLGPPPMGG